MTDQYYPAEADAQHSPPNPPPPPASPGPAPYAYAPPPRRSVFAVMVRIFGSLFILGGVAFGCLALGFYLGLFTSLSQSGVATSVYRDGNRHQQIAIIPVTGLIDPMQAMFFHDAVEQAMDDPNVRAVVLRIDSGGGFVGPSDEMWRDVNRLRERGLYVVASYGSLAASGGYYVSAGADEIYAQPTSITGSIGVMSSAWTFQELMEEKLGIKPEIITATGSPDKDTANNIFRDWTDEDRAVMRDLIDAMHERFAQVVVQGRSGVLSEAEARALCTGKVYTADDARQVKLIDQVGYLDDAIAAAQRGAALSPDAKVIRYDMRGSLSEILGVKTTPPGRLSVKMDGEAARKLLIELATPRMMYLFRP